MNWGFKNGDTSGGNCFMNSQTLSKANHTISIDSTKKRDGNGKGMEMFPTYMKCKILD